MPSSPSVDKLRAEYRSDTPWVGVARPRLTWQTVSVEDGWLQAGAEIELSRPDGTNRTASIPGRDSVMVDWPFQPLTPHDEVALRVRVDGQDGSRSPWSEPLAIRAGFLGPEEWRAPLIGLAGAVPKTPLLLRRAFTLAHAPRRATLYSTSHGVHQAFINGSEVDDERLKPGWTSYQHRLLHETTDVTSLLQQGENVFGIAAAGGWWTERYGFVDSAREVYGSEVSVAAMLVMEFESGPSITLTTDDSWLGTHQGPLVSSGLYAGEAYDARRAMPGWASPGFDSAGWEKATVLPSLPTPVARVTPPVRATAELPPLEVLTTPSGKTLLDFGQNLVGHVRFNVTGPRGTTITLRHAEVLEEGELCLRTLRSAEATDRYTLAGDGIETWEPRFTFHGFRYVEVEGLPREIVPGDFRAIVVGSDMERTGWFESSDPLLNRFHENVVWSMRGNFLAIPMDCPQRDERLGWTGDIQIFAPTASFLYDSFGFLSSWLTDLALEQEANDGVPPLVIPDALGEVMPAAAWGDASVVVPTVLHERYGDGAVLRQQYDSMRAWADVLIGLAGERHLVFDQFQFGDWLDPTAPPNRPEDAKTNPDLVASAYAIRTWTLLESAANELGLESDALKYGGQAARGRASFLDEFVSPNGRMASESPAAYALAICFGLYRDEAQQRAMGERLATLCREAGYRLTTGFVGTPLLCDALTLTGNEHVAFRLISQTECPSWLYPVTMGATTTWERWDSMLEDGSVNPGEMTSFNHYALGSVADWLHRTVAGLSPLEPGYRHFRMAPTPGDWLTNARAEFRSPYGLISCSWRMIEDRLEVSVQVPPNATCEVVLPGQDAMTVGSGAHSWTVEGTSTRAPMPPASLESSLADIIDQPAAHRVLIDAYRSHAPQEAEEFRRRTKWTNGKSLREALNRAPKALLGDLEERFGRG